MDTVLLPACVYTRNIYVVIKVENEALSVIPKAQVAVRSIHVSSAKCEGYLRVFSNV